MAGNEARRYGSASGGQPGTEPQAEAAQVLRSNFFRFSLCFALMHASGTLPLTLASTFLGENEAYCGLGTLYVTAVMGSLFVASPTCAALGLKFTTVAAGGMISIYIGGFATVLLLGPGSDLQWHLWVVCSASGGIAVALLWTAQGGYFAETGAKVAALTGERPEAVKASLAGSFAFWFLIFEVLAKVCFSGLQRRFSASTVSFLYFTLAVLCVMVLLGVRDLRSSSPSASICSPARGVMSLWLDPVIWLMSPVNLTFGFSAAFMNGFVNGVFLKAEVGEKAVSAVAALTPLVAAVGSKLFASVSSSTGKGPIITTGAACFFCIPLFLLVFGCCTGWGTSIIVLYVLQGLGRAVYESTNRATIADFFPRSDTQNAFANCALQSNLGFAVCFFMQAALQKRRLATLVMVLAAITPISYAVARWRVGLGLTAKAAERRLTGP